MRAFRLAYDGRPFHGFQRQPDVPTVEGALLDGLVELDLLTDTSDETDAESPTRPTPPGYAAAGRTDAGVSALAQTVAFEAPDWCTPRALNGALPAAVRAWAWADVPADFHATRDASSRSYRYFLYAPGVDDETARTLLARLEGRTDLHNLAAVDDGDTVRQIYDATAVREGPFLVVDVSADGFLRQSVRRIVAYLDRRLDPSRSAPDPEVVLSAERLDGPEGVGPAPPEPLVLRDVVYDDVDFAVDETARADLREVFATRRRRAAARERVMGTVERGPPDPGNLHADGS